MTVHSELSATLGRLEALHKRAVAVDADAMAHELGAACADLERVLIHVRHDRRQLLRDLQHHRRQLEAVERHARNVEVDDTLARRLQELCGSVDTLIATVEGTP